MSFSDVRHFSPNEKCLSKLRKTRIGGITLEHLIHIMGYYYNPFVCVGDLFFFSKDKPSWSDLNCGATLWYFSGSMTPSELTLWTSMLNNQGTRPAPLHGCTVLKQQKDSDGNCPETNQKERVGQYCPTRSNPVKLSGRVEEGRRLRWDRVRTGYGVHTQTSPPRVRVPPSR